MYLNLNVVIFSMCSMRRLVTLVPDLARIPPGQEINHVAKHLQPNHSELYY